MRSLIIDPVKYSQELLSSGDLTWRRNNRKYRDSLKLNFLMEWPATSDVFDTWCSEEEIVFSSALKTYYKSPLHFAWKTICNLREIETKEEILEIASETEYEKIDIADAISIIRKESQKWWARYRDLLEKNENAYLVWNDGLDICIVFENTTDYIVWGWSSTA